MPTLAGSIYDHGDGRGETARFRRPRTLEVASDGTCRVADSVNDVIRRVAPDGEVTTLAGWPPGGGVDGVGVRLGLHCPSGLAVGHVGTIWVADQATGTVRGIYRHRKGVTRLRLPAGRWPVAVALTPDGRVVVAIVVLDDALRPAGEILAFDPNAPA